MLVNVLHFAPEPVLKNILKANKGICYKSADKFLTDVDFPGEDVQQLSFKSQQFDLIICNHVLEHVPNDEIFAFDRCASRLLEMQSKQYYQKHN